MFQYLNFVCESLHGYRKANDSFLPFTTPELPHKPEAHQQGPAYVVLVGPNCRQSSREEIASC